MKHRTKVLFLSCTIAFICLSVPKKHFAHADPYSEDVHPVPGTLAEQKIIPPKAALQIDDYMIALAKAGNANFIADVTSISQKEMVQPFPATPMAQYFHWQPKLEMVAFDFGQQCKLSQLWYDPTTFLFWKEPNAVQLANQLVKETETDPNEKLPDAVDLYNIVTKDKDLLKDFSKEGKVMDISLSELPPEQRDKALDTIRQLFMGRESSARKWFSDAFWNTATIHLTPMQWNSKPVLSLLMMGNYHQVVTGGSIIGLQAPEETTVKPVSKN